MTEYDCAINVATEILMHSEKTNVLIVDDDAGLLNILIDVIHEFGEYDVIGTTEAEKALSLVRERKFDVVLTDIIMPGIGGLELLRQINGYDPTISVVMITGAADEDVMRSAIRHNAFDFLRKPFDINEIMITVKQAAQKCKLLRDNAKYHLQLKSEVEKRGQELHETRGKLEKSYLNTIYALINAVEAKDIYTKGHSVRVTALSLLLAKKLLCSREELRIIHIGALLHDIGKVGIYDSVLLKDQSLTSEEFDLMKKHPIIGEKIITPVGLPDDVHQIILQHHEWVNGMGYPFGINGDMITKYAKIVSIADAFDAMTSDRCYREDKGREYAFKEILDGGGIQFDADYAAVFYAAKEQIINVLEDKNTIPKMFYGQSGV